MARKPISGTDLSFIILEELRRDGMGPVGIAIVSGRKKGDGASFWKLEAGHICAAIECGSLQRSKRGFNPCTAWRASIDLLGHPIAD